MPNSRLSAEVDPNNNIMGSKEGDLTFETTSSVSKDFPLRDLRNVWFQQNGSLPRKVSRVQQCIRDTFQQQVIGYGGCVEWSPRSSDLNPLDFFSEGIHQTASVCNPSTNIAGTLKPACASVSAAMLYKVEREVQSRVHRCVLLLKDTILSMTDR
ncbi:hypothetical protein AVEN_115041-1 [Araneus ventricosus]|uniref:Uncharacterized protein n=1 Tax=Araneus ventricosus TaxID=182803 RepID=A0A4Y1ZX13_ARAVE|nr:hypothetical protein AVEN_115041-1 [Araneus ventricosus]